MLQPLQRAGDRAPAIQIRPLGRYVGAEVTGVDLRTSLDASTIRRINDAWLRYSVLVLPRQAISDEDQIRFSRCFGPVKVHPSALFRSPTHPEIFRVSNVDADGALYPPDHPVVRGFSHAEDWHVDVTYAPIPSAGSILRGIETTREGGNTLFASLTQAYEEMPASLRARLDGRTAVHAYAYSRLLHGLPPLSAEEAARTPPVVHPLVRRHSVTRRPSVLFNRAYIESISGLGPDERDRLLEDVVAFAAQERHRRAEPDRRRFAADAR